MVKLTRTNLLSLERSLRANPVEWDRHMKMLGIDKVRIIRDAAIDRGFFYLASHCDMLLPVKWQVA